MKLNTIQNGGKIRAYLSPLILVEHIRNLFLDAVTLYCLRASKSIILTTFIEIKTQHLQTDYTNLKHVREELEAALEELNEPYVKRVERNV